uniref:Uncharacterized protein n=1 Tax=Panagrolaimus sp. ES5 TaxID=591445 RepID=A0AC34G9X2_9BILA
MSEHDPIDEEYMLHTNYSWDNFKVLNNNNNTNDSIRRIAVFEHQSRTHVRVYESTTKEYYFRCIECHSKEQEVKAKLSTDGLMFKVFEPFTHICSPKRYLDALMIANASLPVASDGQPQNEESMPSSSSAEEEIDIIINKNKQTAKKKASKKKTKKR